MTPGFFYLLLHPVWWDRLVLTEIHEENPAPGSYAVGRKRVIVLADNRNVPLWHHPKLGRQCFLHADRMRKGKPWSQHPSSYPALCRTFLTPCTGHLEKSSELCSSPRCWHISLLFLKIAFTSITTGLTGRVSIRKRSSSQQRIQSFLRFSFLFEVILSLTTHTVPCFPYDDESRRIYLWDNVCLTPESENRTLLMGLSSACSVPWNTQSCVSASFSSPCPTPWTRVKIQQKAMLFPATILSTLWNMYGWYPHYPPYREWGSRMCDYWLQLTQPRMAQRNLNVGFCSVCSPSTIVNGIEN